MATTQVTLNVVQSHIEEEDTSDTFSLDEVRNSLIRQEDRCGRPVRFATRSLSRVVPILLERAAGVYLVSMRIVSSHPLRAPFTLKSDELCNFLDTGPMGTPLRGCKALSICTNISGLRTMGWSVRWSIRRSIITFTETLKTKEIVPVDLVNLPMDLARTHYESE